MQLTVSNNRTQWFLDFGFDSLVLAKGSRWNLTISSMEIPLAAWSLLLSQRQEFSDNHLPRLPKTHNKQGTFETREEVLSSVGARDSDTKGCEVSDIEDIEFSSENPAVYMDSVYWPGIDTPFSSFILAFFMMGSTTANPILFDDEKYKETSVPTTTTTTPESERPTAPSRLLRSHPFVTRLGYVLESVDRTLFL